MHSFIKKKKEKKIVKHHHQVKLLKWLAEGQFLKGGSQNPPQVTEQGKSVTNKSMNKDTKETMNKT